MTKVNILIAAMIVFIAMDEAKAQLPPTHQLNVWINASCAVNNDPISKENCALLSNARDLIAKGDEAGAEELIAQARNNTLGAPANFNVPMNQRQQHEQAVGNPNWRQY